MVRFLVLASVVFVTVGCQPPPPVQEAKAEPPGAIDYAGWPELTREPVRVSMQAFYYCRGPQPGERAYEEQKKRGPHYVPVVGVYANPTANAHLRDQRTGALPVGSVIVKEKWWDEKAPGPTAYAAMVKREAGYDPEHGDWEYVYAQLGEEPKVERGKLANCAACHAQAVAQDYLFRNYERGAK